MGPGLWFGPMSAHLVSQPIGQGNQGAGRLAGQQRPQPRPKKPAGATKSAAATGTTQKKARVGSRSVERPSPRSRFTRYSRNIEKGASRSPSDGRKLDSRPSPAAHAGPLSVGVKARGNDGLMWVVYKTSNGVHRWKHA